MPPDRNPNSWELADSYRNRSIYSFFKQTLTLYYYKKSPKPHKQIISESLHRNTENTKKPGIIESREALLK